jgi:hypothetical protein
MKIYFLFSLRRFPFFLSYFFLSLYGVVHDIHAARDSSNRHEKEMKKKKRKKDKTPSFGQAPQCPLESLNEGWVAGARSADSP